MQKAPIKRIISCILSLTMVISMFSLSIPTAYGEETENEDIAIDYASFEETEEQLEEDGEGEEVTDVITDPAQSENPAEQDEEEMLPDLDAEQEASYPDPIVLVMALSSDSEDNFIKYIDHEKGLVAFSSEIDISDLGSQLKAEDDSVFEFFITDSSGSEKESGVITDGDKIGASNYETDRYCIYTVIVEAEQESAELTAPTAVEAVNLLMDASEEGALIKIQYKIGDHPNVYSISADNKTIKIISGTTASQLLAQIAENPELNYTILDSEGNQKAGEAITEAAALADLEEAAEAGEISTEEDALTNPEATAEEDVLTNPEATEEAGEILSDEGVMANPEETPLEEDLDEYPEEAPESDVLLESDRFIAMDAENNACAYRIIVMGDTSSTALIPKSIEASNIAEITDNEITLITGYVRRVSYSHSASSANANIDSVSNPATYVSLVSAAEIVKQLQAENGTKQTYEITNASGEEKTTENPANGDKLVVTSEDGTESSEYDIRVVEAALTGKLELWTGEIAYSFSDDMNWLDLDWREEVPVFAERDELTYNTTKTITLDVYSGQRTLEASVNVYVPKGINVTQNNTTVDLIGRGPVLLRDFSSSDRDVAPIGNIAADYPYQTLGTVNIVNDDPDHDGQIIQFRMLDLRPSNGVDLRLVFHDVCISETGEYTFKADLGTKEPTVLQSYHYGLGQEQAILRVVDNVVIERVLDKSLEYANDPAAYKSVDIAFDEPAGATAVTLQSLMFDVNGSEGEWRNLEEIDKLAESAEWTDFRTLGNNARGTTVSNLEDDKLYLFRLKIEGGDNAGISNVIKFYSGRMNIDNFGAQPSYDVSGGPFFDNTDIVNEAITWLSDTGGGTLLFTGGKEYRIRSVVLKSNVYFYVDSDTSIVSDNTFAGGMPRPETAWWSYRDYASGTGTGDGPYRNPDNYLSKQDDGHCFFQNSMFYGMRLDNIKFIGTGLIDGGPKEYFSDGTRPNGPGGTTREPIANRNGGAINSQDGAVQNSTHWADKMFGLKICTNIEIGGKNTGKNLLYDVGPDRTDAASGTTGYTTTKAKPFYEGYTYETADESAETMLKLDKGGHFIVLSTGSEYVNIHDITYVDYWVTNSSRDLYDTMNNRYVWETNLYSRGTSDDIIKIAADCSLGYTQPSYEYKIRNIIGNTNCNLFQLGSETTDKFYNIYFDNFTSLGGNKCGFSISANDGATVHDIWVNYGKTGELVGTLINGVDSGKSYMERCRAPIFISISHRGRIIGAKSVYDSELDERIIYNVPIGTVKDVHLKNIDIVDVWGGSNYNSLNSPSATSTSGNADTVIAGYERGSWGWAPAPVDGRYIGYIENVTLDNVNSQGRGGQAFSTTANEPIEMKVGSYNASNLGVRPAHSYYVRHVKDFAFSNSYMDVEVEDGRYAVVLDDVQNAVLDNIKTTKGATANGVIQVRGSDEIEIKGSSYADFSAKGGERKKLPDAASYIAIQDIEGYGSTGWDFYPKLWKDGETEAVSLQKKGLAPNIKEFDNTLKTIKVVTPTTVAEVLAQLESENPLIPVLTVTTGSDTPKQAASTIADGDILVCSATGTAGEITASYRLLVETPGLDIKTKGNAVNITAVSNDNKTVDAVIGTTAAQLTAQLESVDGYALGFKVISALDADKEDVSYVVDGDKLVISADIGEQEPISSVYTISVQNLLGYYTLLNQLEFSDAGMRGSSSDSGAYYMQTPSDANSAVGRWVGLNIDFPVSGKYKIDWIYKYSATGRAHVQNYLLEYPVAGESLEDSDKLGGIVKLNSMEGATNVTSKYSTAASTSNKYFNVTLADAKQITAGAYQLRSVVTAQGAIVVYGAVITLLELGEGEDEPARNIQSVASLPDIVVDYGALVSDLGLPSEVQISLEDEAIASLAVSWDTSVYNGSQAGAYVLQGTLILPEDGSITNTSDITAKVTITVNEQIPVLVESITIDGASSSSLGVGQNLQLYPAIQPYNATNKEIIWKSSNPAIASVSSNGVVKGVKAGLAVITAISVDGEKQAKATITVKAAKSTIVSPYLSDLQIDGITVEHFMSATYDYRITLSDDGSEPEITAVSVDSEAEVIVEMPEDFPGAAVITVRAKDGKTIRTYTIYINLRPGAPE